jgi:protocatechuate 3,4-dioxygenase beta subunit
VTDRHSHDERDIFDQGLAADVATLLNRRRALLLFGAAGAATVAGGAIASASDRTPAGNAVAACVPDIPQETAGPFPADGSNGPDVLTESGIVRRDVRPSFGGMTGLATGEPLLLNLTIEHGATCRPFAGAAVYMWQCDKDGKYTMYSIPNGDGLPDQNYLRGVQVADARGRLTFLTVFPGCYPGRWPHIHLELYPSVTAATTGGKPQTTSQLAMPPDECDKVYKTTPYAASAKVYPSVSLATDMVFADGYALQMPKFTGNPRAGYHAAITISI